MLVEAASIIISHNHPSSILDISDDDRKVSKRIKQAGELFGCWQGRTEIIKAKSCAHRQGNL